MAYLQKLEYIPKIHEIIKNDEDIEVITQIFNFSSREIYSDLIKDKKILEGEEIFKSVCSCLKYERHKDETKFIFAIILLLNNEFELAYEKFNTIVQEIENLEEIKAICLNKYLEVNLKHKTNFEKCKKFLDIYKSLNIKEKEENFENYSNEIKYKELLLFITQCELEFKKNDFSSYEKIEKMLEKEIDAKSRLKLENLKKSLIKNKKDFYFKQKNYDEFLKQNKNISNLISEIYKEESLEDIEKKKYNSALDKIDKSLKINPNNLENISNKAYVNAMKGNYDEAFKNIDMAVKLNPENKILQNNKLEIIDKKYENELKKNKIKKINKNVQEYLENNILENKDIDIQKNSIDLSIKLTKNKLQKIEQDTMKNIINNNILNIKDNVENFNIIKDDSIQNEQDKIILASKSTELIYENIKNNNINFVDKEMKEQLEECLDIKDKDIQNNILSTYSKIKNFTKQEMERPLKIINQNLEYETDNNQIIKNVDVIQNFLEQEKNIDITKEITSNLIDVISNNDYTKYSEEEKINDDFIDQNKPLIQYFKDKTKEGIARELKRTLNESSNNKEFSKQIKSKFNIDIENDSLKNSQKEKKITNDKIFNCIQTIAKTEKGLDEQNFENFGNILEKIEENSNKEYKDYVKNKIIETVDISLDNKSKKIKIPDNLINNLSKELNTAQSNSDNSKGILNILNKVSDNQILSEETQENLINILRDKNRMKELNNNGNNINEDDSKYELTYKILNKNYNNLSDNQKKIIELEKNSLLLKNEKNQKKIINSLDNISAIMDKGYTINKHTENQILDVLKENQKNEEILNSSTKIVNNLAKGSNKISNEMSQFIISKIEEENNNKNHKLKNDINKPKLSKKAFTELLACLVNIVENCDVPENSSEVFHQCLKDYKNKGNEAELKLAINGLYILSKKDYSLNKEAINSCLDIIQLNDLDNNSLKELSTIIDKIFKETDIEEKAFSKLLMILIKNSNLLEQLSICLLNSLKFKKKEDIENIIEKNINNFEKMIIDNLVNDNIINIIEKVDNGFYFSRSKIIYDFYNFDLFCSEKVIENNKFKKILNFIKQYGIINQKYLNVLIDNINSSETLDILEKILEKNKNYINEQIYDKMLKININDDKFKKVLSIIKRFSKYYLSKETIDILALKCQTDINEIYEPIIELLRYFYEKNQNNFEKIELINKDILLIEVKEEKTKNYLILINNFIFNNNFIPKRYYYKLISIISNITDKNLYDYGFNIFLLSINKNLIIPGEIIEQLFTTKNNKLYIKLIQNLLINKDYKKKYSNKLIELIKSKISKKEIIEIINNLQNLIDFSELEDSIKDYIIKNVNRLYNLFVDYKKLYYWIKKSDSSIDKNYCNMFIEEMKKTKFFFNKNEMDNFINKEIFHDKINELSFNNINNYNTLKNAINSFEDKILQNEKDRESKLVELLNFFISQKIKFNFNYDEILACFNVYLLNKDIYIELVNNLENRSEPYFNVIRKKWIELKLKEEKKTLSVKQMKKIIDMFYIYKFEDNLIEKCINLNIFSSFEHIIKFFDFIKENKKYLKEIKEIIKALQKNETIDIFINKIIFLLSLKKINEIKISPESKMYYYLLVQTLIKINWKFYQIDELLSTKINYNCIDEAYFKQIIIPIIENNSIKYDTVNNKKENLISILSKYNSKYWEYLLKSLGQNYEQTDEYSLDDLIREFKAKNKYISYEICDKIKNIIEETRKKYNSKIDGNNFFNNLPDYPIRMYDKQNIKDWAKSKRTLSSINEIEFLPEALAVIDRANEIQEGNRLRYVQYIPILLILLSPKDKGVLSQIKTGEGKSTIISVIAVIKALQNKYVDILTSSIVLAHRDKEEKKEFYGYFNLSVGSSDENEEEEDDDDDDNNEENIKAGTSLYEKNIVYGDALMFEGDIIRVEFSQDPNSERAKNLKRDFRCLIIDEVDSMCVDHLGSSTLLCSSFPSYEYLKIIYIWIYSNLYLIEKNMEEGNFEEIKDEESREKFVVEKLIDVTKELIKQNSNSKDKLILPKNLHNFIECQLPKWCNSAYEARHYYRSNYHYVISKDKINNKMKKNMEVYGFKPEEEYLIAPVDFPNSGVVELHMNWSNGLSQFLQIKHGLKITSEHLTTIYLSHYSFFRRYITQLYGNNIYGVTGTVGTEKTRKLLKKLFEVDVYIIPPFCPSKLIKMNNIANFLSRENWKKEIINNINMNANELKRAVLVIFYTIEESNEFYDDLIKKGFDKNKLYKYQRNDKDDTNDNNNSDNLLKESYEIGDIILATNLAGRGTNIKLCEEVKKNGGLHVIITFLPSNLRVEEQGMGRTARSGQPGSSIIIVNDERNMEEIIKLRDNRENKRIDYIEKKELNMIKLKDKLFNKFSKFYHEFQKQVIKEDLLSLTPMNYNYYKNLKYANEFSILNDLEERWGLWLNEMSIEYSDKSEEEIEISYKNFENNLKSIFDKQNKNEISLINPLNYLSGKRFKEASENDSELCFYAQYLNDMSNINTLPKNEIIDTLNKTISYLKDSLSSQIQFSAITVNEIKKYNLFTGLALKEISKDAENKLKAIDNLINQIESNKNIIEQSMDKNSRYFNLKECRISQITKSIKINDYLIDIGIPYFYDIKIEKEKKWISIISIMAIGAFEIGLGLMLSNYTFIDFGLVEEGIADIMYGFDCILGRETIDWKDIGKRKVAFGIKLAVNISTHYIKGILKIPTNKNVKQIKSFSDTFSLIGNQVKDRIINTSFKFGLKISFNIFGDNLIITIIKRVNEFIKYLSIKFYVEKIQQYILKKFGDTLDQMLTIEIVSGKNEWTRIITQQLKIGCRALFKLKKVIIKQVINIIKSIINREGNWKSYLDAIFSDMKEFGLDTFKEAVNESLENLQLGFLNIFKKFAERKLPDGIREGFLTFNDILDKVLNICDALKTKRLMEVLIENDLINEKGIINGKLLFGKDYNPKNLRPIPLLTDNLKKFVIKKVINPDNIIDLISGQSEYISTSLKDHIENKMNEGMKILDEFLNTNLREILEKKISVYIIESIQKLESNKDNTQFNIGEELNNIEKNVIDNFKKVEVYTQDFENYIERLEKIEKILKFIEKKVDKYIIRIEKIIDEEVEKKIKSIKNILSTFEQTILSKINNKDKENEKNENKFNILEEPISQIKQILNEKIDYLRKEWKKIKKSNAVNNVRKTVKQSQAILFDIIDKLNSVIKLIKENLQRINNFIKNTGPLIEEFKELKEEVFDNENSTPVKIQLVKDFLHKNLENKTQFITNKIMKKIDYIKDNIFQNIAKFIDDFKFNFKKNAEILNEIIEKIENFISEQIKVLSDKFGLNKIGNIIEESSNNLFNEISNKVKEKTSQMDELISNKIHNALEDIDFKEFKEQKLKIITTLKDFQKKIDDYDFDSKKNETFKLLEITMVNEIFDVVLDAVYSTEFGKYIKGYIEEYRGIIENASSITKLAEYTDVTNLKIL